MRCVPCPVLGELVFTSSRGPVVQLYKYDSRYSVRRYSRDRGCSGAFGADDTGLGVGDFEDLSSIPSSRPFFEDFWPWRFPGASKLGRAISGGC